jgi:ABC-2 type transport system ATP-binding protein
MMNKSPGPAIAVDGLLVVRGGRTVLDALSFEVPSGTVTGLLGPSGCGKTTLMRAIVGVQKVAGGHVNVLGHPAGAAPLRSKVGYVTQAPSVYADLTVNENLRYFATILGAPSTDVDRVVGEVGLEEYVDTLSGALSGGQRARVSLAAALLGTPELLVLDEPTVGLDPVLRRDLWAMFHQLADAGATLLISSHVMDEASRCDRLLLMRDGHLLADDTPGALLEQTGKADIEAAFLALVDRDSQPAPTEQATKAAKAAEVTS